jgi:hypothetical protein
MAAFERHEDYRLLDAPTCETRFVPNFLDAVQRPHHRAQSADGYRASMELTVALLQLRAASRRCSPEATNLRGLALPPP